MIAIEYFELWRAMVCNFPQTSIKTLLSGARLIQHLPKVGPQAYLHVLPAPCDEEQITALETLFEYALPDSYKMLMSYCNGMTLFSGSFYGLGYAPPATLMDRSITKEDRHALSIQGPARYFRLMHPEIYSQGWRTIGSFSGWADQYQVILHHDGRVQFFKDTWCSRDFGNIFEFLVATMKFYESYYNEAGVRKGAMDVIDSHLPTLGQLLN
jgi:hypothetical protein